MLKADAGRGTAAELALEHYGVEVVRALHDVGAPFPSSVQASAGWRHREEKLALLAELAIPVQRRTAAELLGMRNAQAGDVVEVLSAQPGLLGLRPGMPMDAVKALGLRSGMGVQPQTLTLRVDGEEARLGLTYASLGHEEFGSKILPWLEQRHGKGAIVEQRSNDTTWRWDVEGDVLTLDVTDLSEGVVPVWSVELRYDRGT